MLRTAGYKDKDEVLPVPVETSFNVKAVIFLFLNTWTSLQSKNRNAIGTG